MNFPKKKAPAISRGFNKDIEKFIPETVDLIYHLGEYSRVEKSFEEPALVWDLNKDGTFGVVEFWRKRGCKLMYAGSSTKFGDGGLGRDQSPYAWTKAANRPSAFIPFSGRPGRWTA